VVLALQDRLAYGPTFASALASLYNGTTSSLTAAEPSAPQQAPSQAAAPSTAANLAPAGADSNALIAQASRDFDDYQRLTAQGKLSEAGQKLDDLKKTLDQLNARHR